jgi:hypothetical protein
LAITVVGAVALVMARADEPAKMPLPEGKMPPDMMQHMNMRQHMKMCGEMCQTNIQRLEEARAALDTALQKMDAGDLAAARKEVETARQHVTMTSQDMKACMQQMMCCNLRCPITGKPINMKDLPADQTRMYQGMKVGFCSASCPQAWDQLSDAEKEAALKKVCMPPMMKKEVEPTPPAAKP